MTRQCAGSFINGQWVPGSGARLVTYDPVTCDPVYSGFAVSEQQVDVALLAAQDAWEEWANAPYSSREAVLLQFSDIVQSRRDEFATAISSEVGKPYWEAISEVNAVATKCKATIEAYNQRLAPATRQSGTSTAHTRYHPFGVVAVLGPYNFPFHMPNGHIMPALICGNSVVFKPSELAPSVAELTVQAWLDAGLPASALTLLQGHAEVGQMLVASDNVAGVYFTGSLSAGLSISRALAETPWRLAALEMGGNSPLVVWDYSDSHAAAYNVAYSAFVTSGQRCSSARRMILNSAHADLVERVCELARTLKVAHYTERPEPFMGPIATRKKALAVIQEQERLEQAGGKVLLRAKALDDRSALITPGVVDVTGVEFSDEVEIMGPLLRVTRVESFSDAITEANRTKYGLAACLVSADKDKYITFRNRIRAGVINWNVPLPGASSFSPFGGIRASGNNRPSGYFAVDHASYPIASIESEVLSIPDKLPPGIPV